MPNIANVLKAEISRIAKREVRAETRALKKASGNCRTEIAALKRRAADLENQLRRLSKQLERSPAPAANLAAQPVKFSAKSLASQRRRLKLSAESLGLLVGVSTQSIYNWERGATAPYTKHIPALAALKTLTPRQAGELVAARKQARGGTGMTTRGG